MTPLASRPVTRHGNFPPRLRCRDAAPGTSVTKRVTSVTAPSGAAPADGICWSCLMPPSHCLPGGLPSCPRRCAPSPPPPPHALAPHARPSGSLAARRIFSAPASAPGTHGADSHVRQGTPGKAPAGHEARGSVADFRTLRFDAIAPIHSVQLGASTGVCAPPLLHTRAAASSVENCV